MCCLEDFGVEDTIAAADKVACKCQGGCPSRDEISAELSAAGVEEKHLFMAVEATLQVLGHGSVEGYRRLKRAMDELPTDEGDWLLEPTEAGGDVN